MIAQRRQLAQVYGKKARSEPEHFLNRLVTTSKISPAARTTPIQRKVGFEFEVPNWRVTSPVGGLGKNTRLMDGAGWYLQTDTQGDVFDPEFVTRPVEETDAGWRQLDGAMQHMDITLQTLAAIPDHNNRTILHIGGSHPHASVTRHGPLIGDPQISAGIRLDRIPRLLQDLGHPAGAVVPQSPASAQLAAGAGAALNLATARANARAVAVQHGARVRSEAYEGLIALMGAYLIHAAEIFPAYTKQAAHIMSRSSLPSAFGQTRESNWHGRVPANTLVADVLAVANIAASPWLFPVGMQHANDEDREREPWRFVGRDAWIRGIANGRDILAEARGASSSMGAMGLERVGPAQTRLGFDVRPKGIILELRDVQMNIPYEQWYAFAIAVFQYIREMNDLNIAAPAYHPVANFGTPGVVPPAPAAPPPAQPGWFARQVRRVQNLAATLRGYLPL